MPPRLLLALTLLALGGIGWLLFGGADDGDGTVGTGAAGADGPAGDPTLRETAGPGLAAGGRARGPRGTGALAPSDPDAAPTSIGEPRPELVRVPLRGVVRDRDGRPIAGALVLVQRRGGPPISVRADARGRYALTAAPGRYRMVVLGGRDGAVVLEELIVDGSAGGAALEVALGPPGRLAVIVRTGENPVPGAELTITHGIAGSLDERTHTTDAGGTVRVDDLPPGTYAIVARVPNGPTLRETVDVVAGRSTDVDLALPATTILRGLVRVGRDGPGVSGAEVRLVSQVGDVAEEIITTGSTLYDGSFELAVPRGPVTDVRVTAQGYAVWPTPRERGAILSRLRGLAKGPPVQLDVRLAPGRTLAGRVTTAGAEPVAELALRAMNGDESLARAVTDADGRYAFEHLQPRRYELHVESPGWFPARGQVMRVLVPETGTTSVTTLDIRAVRARTIQGIVSGPTAPHVPGARVWIVGGGQAVESARERGRVLETFTDANGWWRIADIPPDRSVVVRAALDLLEAPPFALHAAAEPPPVIALRLAGTGSIAGTVVDASDRAPIAGATVQLVPVPYDGRTVIRVETDAAGAYAARGLIPGGWQLHPAKDGYLAGAITAVHVEAEGTSTQALQLDPGETFAGTVIDEAGAPVPRALVVITGVPTHGARTAGRSIETDDDGTFRLSGFPPGVYTVTAALAGYRTVRDENLRGGRSNLRLILRRP